MTTGAKSTLDLCVRRPDRAGYELAEKVRWQEALDAPAHLIMKRSGAIDL
ncbi:hypothetical protein J2X55_002522 [Microbacterium sp. 1154]|nr:hypothetical protein [Microbacterium sp. 1154]MDR6691599.1 hypothetical protein [Microbacterium sp. 1154]